MNRSDPHHIRALEAWHRHHQEALDAGADADEAVCRADRGQGTPPEWADESVTSRFKWRFGQNSIENPSSGAQIYYPGGSNEPIVLYPDDTPSS